MFNHWSYIIFRTCLSSIFLVAGIGHVLSPDKLVARLVLSPGWPLLAPFFDPKLLIVLTGIVLLVGGLGLLFNFRPKQSAFVLIGVLIPITLTVQVGSSATLGPLFKNIAILGGLVLVAFQKERMEECKK
ncbi:MAG: DoxX family membrane protein [Bacteriovoracaceae bacterium]|nr:DoxX family membrane protein [Bacteriovoracaceae bacterium]